MRGSLLPGLLTMLLCLPAAAAEPLSSSQRHVEKAGTALQFAIPAAALLATYLIEPAARTGMQGDAQQPAGFDVLRLGGTPRHDLFVALGRTAVVTFALKNITDETRPNGGSQSFPSGHTSISFAGAEFLRKQYGWRWGAPAYVAAGFVGWSRVEARKHYTHDVIAGAVIGILANHDWWEWNTRSGRVSLVPAPVFSDGRVAQGIRLEFVY